MYAKAGGVGAAVLPNADPTELTNIYNSASQTLRSELKARLEALKICARADTSATSCKRAENGG